MEAAVLIESMPLWLTVQVCVVLYLVACFSLSRLTLGRVPLYREYKATVVWAYIQETTPPAFLQLCQMGLSPPPQQQPLSSPQPTLKGLPVYDFLRTEKSTGRSRGRHVQSVVAYSTSSDSSSSSTDSEDSSSYSSSSLSSDDDDESGKESGETSLLMDYTPPPQQRDKQESSVTRWNNANVVLGAYKNKSRVKQV
jgi:hypothetical protein